MDAMYAEKKAVEAELAAARKKLQVRAALFLSLNPQNRRPSV